MVDRRLKLLLDAIDAIALAVSFMGTHSLEDYSADLMLCSAVERQLEILGEACARLAKIEPDLFDRIPACRSAVGLRNRIAHGYDTLDNGIVRNTVLTELPALGGMLQAWLKQLDPLA